jgi:protein-tyrosine phosphatase
MLEKGILLPGVGNARQLGGYRIKDKRIRDGVLIRSAALNQATPEAVEILRNKYRIQSVIDFRMSSERQFRPDPAIPGSDNIHLPVLEMEDAMIGVNPRMVEQYTASKTDRMALFNVAYESGMLSEKLYTDFLLKDRGGWRFGDSSKRCWICRKVAPSFGTVQTAKTALAAQLCWCCLHSVLIVRQSCTTTC